MTYSDFETRLLLALAVAAADGSQPSAFVVAETVAPGSTRSGCVMPC